MSAPRITSGKAKNMKLKVPMRQEIRAVKDVVKLAIFSIIGDSISGAECLDLYAGIGSLGLEALSRGAKFCDFVETDYKTYGTLQENIRLLGFNDNAEIHKEDAVKFAANAHKKYDLIFADPFYHELKHKFLMHNLEETLNPQGLIIFLHGKELNLRDQISNTNLKVVTERKFGSTYFTVLSH